MPVLWYSDPDPYVNADPDPKEQPYNIDPDYLQQDYFAILIENQCCGPVTIKDPDSKLELAKSSFLRSLLLNKGTDRHQFVYEPYNVLLLISLVMSLLIL